MVPGAIYGTQGGGGGIVKYLNFDQKCLQILVFIQIIPQFEPFDIIMQMKNTPKYIQDKA